MPVCSYVVIPDRGASERLAARLAGLEGCDVVRPENRALLLLVTDTPDPQADRALRRTIEKLPELRALILSFGEIDPETDQRDPIHEGREPRKRRRGVPLPTVPGPGKPR